MESNHNSKTGVLSKRKNTQTKVSSYKQNSSETSSEVSLNEKPEQIVNNKSKSQRRNGLTLLKCKTSSQDNHSSKSNNNITESAGSPDGAKNSARKRKSNYLKTSKKNLKLMKNGKNKIEGTDDNIPKENKYTYCEEDHLKSPNSQPMDAFQVMMEARKKSIGLNSPGRELEIVETKDISQKELKAKRFLSLSKWADEKGASKHKELEELKDQQIQSAMEKRASNLKEMLQNQSKITKKGPETKPDKVKESISEFESIFKCGNSSLKRKQRIVDSKSDLGDNSLKKSKLHSPTSIKNSVLNKKNKNSRKHCNNLEPEKLNSESNATPLENTPLSKRNKVQNTKSKFSQLEKSKEKLGVGSIKKLKSESRDGSFISEEGNNKTPFRKSNRTPAKSVDDDFLAKLSPPLKKTESLLSYFEKKEDHHSEGKQDDLILINSEDNLDISKNSKIIRDKVKSKAVMLKKCKKFMKNTKLKKKFKSEIVEELLQEINNVTTDDESLQTNGIEESVGESSFSTREVTPSRPKRLTKKPLKYIQESSESDSQLSSNSNEFHIFSPKKTRKSNKRLTNKENVICIDDDKVSPIKIINLQSPGKLLCVKPPKVVPKSDASSNVKLAPLFRKNIPKPIIDQSVLEARKLFLQSGVPESIKNHFEKSVCVTSDYDVFSAVHHIQSKPNESDKEYHIWNLPPCKYTFDVDTCEEMLDEVGYNCKQFINIGNCHEVLDKWFLKFNQLEVYGLKDGLKVIKNHFPKFPVNRTFKQLWEKYANVTRNSHKTDSQEQSDSNAETSNYLWTEKYKPLSSRDILGNFNCVNFIKKWLESWKEYNDTPKISKRTRRNSNSSDDFFTSDSESRDSARTLNNTIVVFGPPGSGKTSCIYALANELGINVLEVNASSKRTGRKILSELHEATQSHKVITKLNSEGSMSNFFSDSSTVNSDNLKDNVKNMNEKKYLSKVNSKSSLLDTNAKLSQPDTQTLSGESCSQKVSDANTMSLMLIEDADVVFEEDDGFVGALAQLVQSSKRPVIIVASDNNCNHLQRFVTESNVVDFQPLSSKILGPWLDVLILIETRRIMPTFCSSLLEVNKGDMRSTVLQLQYWVDNYVNNILENPSIKDGEVLLPEHSASEELPDDEPNGSWLQANDNSQLRNSPNAVGIPHINSVNKSSIALKSIIIEKSQDTLVNLWWNTSSFLQRRSSIDNPPSEVSNSNSTWSEMNALFNIFETLSSVDLMQSCSRCNIEDKELALLPWHNELKNSLSESENYSMFNNHEQLSSDWCQYVIEKSNQNTNDALNEDDNTLFLDTLHLRSSKRSKLIFTKFSEAISLGTQLDRVGVALDYMPSLRNMCRSEKSRSTNNIKRNNRFHHYLNSLNVNVNEKIFNNACNVFELNAA